MNLFVSWITAILYFRAGFNTILRLENEIVNFNFLFQIYISTKIKEVKLHFLFQHENP